MGWALEAAVLQAIAGAFSREESCKASGYGSQSNCSPALLTISEPHQGLCSGATLEVDLMKLLLPGWAVKQWWVLLEKRVLKE